jgi:hypothetical protein
MTVSAAEAARLMGVDLRSVQRYVADGKLDAVATPALWAAAGDGTAYRIPVESLPAAAQIGLLAGVRVRGAGARWPGI